MKGGRSRVLHRHGRLVHPWAPPGPREHRGRLSPGRCARRTRGGRVQPFLAVFGAQRSRAPAHLPSEFEECIARAGGSEVSGASVHLPGPRPSTARARSIAHRRRYALLCQMRGASVLMRRRGGSAVQRRVKRPSDARCAHVHNFGSSAPIFTLKLVEHAPRRADSSAHGGQHDGQQKPSSPELGRSRTSQEGYGRIWKDMEG